MIQNIISVSVCIIGAYLVMYIINRKSIRALPYTFMILVTPLYEMLNNQYLYRLFGTIGAYRFRSLVYRSILIVMVVLGIIFARRFKHKRNKITYVITILLTNVTIALLLLKFSKMFQDLPG